MPIKSLYRYSSIRNAMVDGKMAIRPQPTQILPTITTLKERSRSPKHRSHSSFIGSNAREKRAINGWWPFDKRNKTIHAKQPLRLSVECRFLWIGTLGITSKRMASLDFQLPWTSPPYGCPKIAVFQTQWVATNTTLVLKEATSGVIAHHANTELKQASIPEIRGPRYKLQS